MKPLLAVGLAATLIGCAGAERYSSYEPPYVELADPNYEPAYPSYEPAYPSYEPAYPSYEPADPSYGPPRYYRHRQPQYHEPRHYRRYGQSEYDHPPGRRAWNGCRPGYTVQDGRCRSDPGYY
jgi:DNA-directed RNA polymerase II subunit RPB1